MSIVEQFVNFLNSLTTPKKALQTLMAIIGAILSIVLFFPWLNLILEMSPENSIKEYKSYTFFISIILGCSLALVLFNLLEFLCQKAISIARETRTKNDNKKKNAASLLTINNKIIEDFRIAHPHLDEHKKAIIRRLINVDNESYKTDSTHCIFLEKQTWIIPLVSNAENSNVFKLNPLLKEMADDLWNQEIEDNISKFLSSDSDLIDCILNPFYNINTRKDIPGYTMRTNKALIEKCFDIKEITENCVIFNFKERYKEKFEEFTNKKLNTSILFIIDDKAIPF